MKMAENQQIAVIGAGLMGHGIALTFARAGQYVALYDPSQDMLGSAPQRISESMKLTGSTDEEIAKALKKIELHSSIGSAVSKAVFVFEAAPEKLDLKKAIFADIEANSPNDAILASNTSVIPITKIMGDLAIPNRAVGTHWWNPPHIIPLVEVVKTEWTDLSAANQIQELLADAGKTPVMVEKDVPGFIGNRLQHALWREAISLVENGICSAEAVDDVVKASFGRRLAVLGPLENADLVGLELTQDIHKQVLFDLSNCSEPSPYLQELRDQGRGGMSSGAGLREWKDGDLEATKARVANYLKKLEAILPE